MVKIVQLNDNNKRRRRVTGAQRRRKRVRGGGGVQQALVRTLVPRPLPINNRKLRGLTPAVRKGNRMLDTSRNFLRAAFAPVDFNRIDVSGVPDTYTGPSIVLQHTYIGTLSVSASNSLLALVAPTPGYAYWAVTGGTDPDTAVTGNWGGAPFGDAGQLFPTTSSDETVVTDYRYIGLCAEITPASPTLTNSGQVRVNKLMIPVKHIQRATNGATGAAVAGASLPYVDLTPCAPKYTSAVESYVNHPNNGAYAVAFNNGDWTFCPVERYHDLPATKVYQAGAATEADWESKIYSAHGRLKCHDAQPYMAGIGHHESILFYLKNADTTKTLDFNIEIHAIVEYIPSFKSILYKSCTESAPPDPMTLLAYARLVPELPLAVPYYDNAGFWDFIKKAWRALLSMGKLGTAMPHPVAQGLGAAAIGLEALTDAIANM